MSIVFFVTVFLAEIVGTLAGFGSSTILLPIALLFFNFKTALVLVACAHLFGNISRAAFFRVPLAWRILVYFGTVGVISTIIGALFVTHINQDLLKGGLGIFLIAYGLFAWLHPSFKMSPTKPNMLLGGASSGVLTGLIGTGGALRSVFLTAYNLPKSQYIGTAAVMAIAVDGARIPLYLKNGLLEKGHFWMLPMLFLLASAGALVGKQLTNKISQAMFERIVLICLMLAGLKLAIDYLLTIF